MCSLNKHHSTPNQVLTQAASIDCSKGERDFRNSGVDSLDIEREHYPNGSLAVHGRSNRVLISGEGINLTTLATSHSEYSICTLRTAVPAPNHRFDAGYNRRTVNHRTSYLQIKQSSSGRQTDQSSDFKLDKTSWYVGFKIC